VSQLWALTDLWLMTSMRVWNSTPMVSLSRGRTRCARTAPGSATCRRTKPRGPWRPCCCPPPWKRSRSREEGRVYGWLWIGT
jgi:hypothetical protein